MVAQALPSHEESYTRAPKVAKFRRPEPPKFQDKASEAQYRKRRLVDACRIICNEGWAIGFAANLSIRDVENPQTIWTIPSGKPLRVITTEDLLHFSLDADLLGDLSDAKASYDVNQVALHVAIYRSRPDVGAIIHAHTPNAKAFSMQGKTIDMICQDSCTFHNRMPVLPFKTGINALFNPQAVADVLKDGKGLIMQNRGVLSVGASIECTISYIIRLENLCKAQLLAEAACRGRGGSLVLVGEEEVQFTYENTGSEHHAWLMAMPYFARVDRQNAKLLAL